MEDFVHLHVHTYYSILDGMSPIPKLIDKAVKNGMKGLAITDHGNMFGIKELVDYCAKLNKDRKKEGLEPLVFMHYPPIFATNFNYDILEILYRYNIKECYYGHIHGRSAHELCVKNTYDGVNFHLISGDYIHFMPEKVL